jgi:hypothetical protein
MICARIIQRLGGMGSEKVARLLDNTLRVKANLSYKRASQGGELQGNTLEHSLPTTL